MRLPLLALLASALCVSASANPVLYYSPTPLANGLGTASANEFTQAVVNAFGSGNIHQVADFSNTANFSDADALFVNARLGTDVLSVQERTNIMNFINDGGAVFFIGEHTGWQAWDDSFLSLFDSSATIWGTAVQAALATPAAVAAGFPTSNLNLSGPGAIAGSTGTTLYASAVNTALAKSFGPSGNAIAFLDTNAFSSNSGRGFYEGLASWLHTTASEHELAAEQPPVGTVPDSDVTAAFAATLVALAAWRRRRA